MYDLEEINKRATETIKAIANGKAEMAGFAWTMFEALQAQIKAFENRLDPTQETAAQLANFGSKTTLVITEIGFRHPHLIVLAGIDETGQRQELIQHVSQVSLLLIAVLTQPDQPPRRIGFLADLEKADGG